MSDGAICVFCGSPALRIVKTGQNEDFVFPMCFFCSRVIKKMFPDYHEESRLHTEFYSTKKDRKRAVRDAEEAIDRGRRGRDNSDNV